MKRPKIKFIPLNYSKKIHAIAHHRSLKKLRKPIRDISRDPAVKTIKKTAKVVNKYTNKYAKLKMKNGELNELFINLSSIPDRGFKIKNTKRLKHFKVKIKPRSVMGDYIALHGLVPNNELPKKLRNKIPKNEVWIRKDCFVDHPIRQRRLLTHENHELGLMQNKGLTYKKAHKRANMRETFWGVPFEIID